jgi:hypothetical protein
MNTVADRPRPSSYLPRPNTLKWEGITRQRNETRNGNTVFLNTQHHTLRIDNCRTWLSVKGDYCPAGDREQ